MWTPVDFLKGTRGTLCGVSEEEIREWWELVETESAKRDFVESVFVEVLGKKFGTSGISKGIDVWEVKQGDGISGIAWGKTKLSRYIAGDKVGEGMDAREKMCS